mmetsp:Transcript_9972/g.21560  ORF Transcript_9972/g.21560 Transcript_9972/m.21560 type:complete len:149 (+) Transcript_9972:445-891(+)
MWEAIVVEIVVVEVGLATAIEEVAVAEEERAGMVMNITEVEDEGEEGAEMVMMIWTAEEDEEGADTAVMMICPMEEDKEGVDMTMMMIWATIVVGATLDPIGDHQSNVRDLAMNVGKVISGCYWIKNTKCFVQRHRVISITLSGKRST